MRFKPISMSLFRYALEIFLMVVDFLFSFLFLCWAVKLKKKNLPYAANWMGKAYVTAFPEYFL